MLRPPSPSSHQRGAQAEARAAAYLRAQGFTILTQNYRWRHGEIDLICREGDTLCFVEVRSRASDRHGSAAATINAKKQGRIARAAEHFLTVVWKDLRVACRFDVISIDGELLTLHRDAFRLGG